MRVFSRKKEKMPEAIRFVLPAIILMIFAVVLSQSTSATMADSAEDSAEPSEVNPLLFFFILLLVCTVIGILAPLSGTGGAVVFTPVFMGFTSIDSYIIRTTGLAIAMSGALVAARPFLRKGIANIRLVLIGSVPYALFAVIGALLARYIKTNMGNTSEAYIRGSLGIIVIGVGCLFIFLGKRVEYPGIKNVDNSTQGSSLSIPYYEASLGKVVDYKITKVSTGLILFCGVGLISGLFGLGAGWALVPVFNMVMLAPLKVAATCSTVMTSIGSTAAVWPYIRGGGMFPLFAVPCMIGLIGGALIGSRIMVKVKAGFIRWIIIAVMMSAGVRLVIKAITML
jgi:uncharacterized membrane protein YfcA